MPQISERDWVRQEPCAIVRAWQSVVRFSRRAIPSILSLEMTLGGFLLFGAQLIILAAISLVPVAFAAYIAPTDDKGIPASAWWQALLLLCLQVSKYVLDKLKLRGAGYKHRMHHLSCMSVSLAHALGHIASAMRVRSSRQDTEHLLHHALTCIASIVKLCTENNDDHYFCVSLLTFEADNTVCIRARSVTNRRTGGRVPREDTIAYWVALSGVENKAVHDFPAECRKHELRMLSHKSLSTSTTPPYVSILLLPLPLVPMNGGKVRKGVVTIDAGKCYEFLGLETAIHLRIGGYLELINALLVAHTTGVQPEVSDA